MLMQLKFSKYHGTGNDFIMVYNHNESFTVSHSSVKKMCDRRYGVGADGLIIIEKTLDKNWSSLRWCIHNQIRYWFRPCTSLKSYICQSSSITD